MIKSKDQVIVFYKRGGKVLQNIYRQILQKKKERKYIPIRILKRKKYRYVRMIKKLCTILMKLRMKEYRDDDFVSTLFRILRQNKF